MVKRELDDRIESLEQKENRKLKKVEKQTLKDDVVMNLLPRAFSKISIRHYGLIRKIILFMLMPHQVNARKMRLHYCGNP